jgi:glutaredoxin
MFTVIFGRPGCPYCVRAKELAEKLTNERDDFNYRYVDIHAEGISKADLEKPSANRLKPYRRFSSTRNTSAVAPISKPGRKRTLACLPESIYLLDE